MYAFLPRLVSTTLLVLFCSVGPLAIAQTTIQMNTAQGSCTAVTDSSGLTLVPNSTELQANGVTLTAQQAGACNPAGGGSASNFSASVQISGSTSPGAPYTPAVNAPFYVIWSTTADANVCTRGAGALSGLSGWVPGSQACSGNCAGNHAEQVTPTTAGSYAFSVTCTNASGFATSSAVVVPPGGAGAPTPSSFTVTTPPTATAGNSFTATWPMITNAASCVGTATLGGAAITGLGEWTTSTATTPQSRSVAVPASATGNLVLTLTCWNSDHSASAVGISGAIAVSPASAGSCPSTISMPGGTRTLLATSSITYGVYPPSRPAVNVLEWDNIWGHATTSDAITAWPGVNGSFPVFRQFNRYSYVGAHFKTPAASQVTGLSGRFFNNSASLGGPNTTMAISKTCGDFSANLPSPGCFIDHNFGDPAGTGVPADGSQMVVWNFTSNAPNSVCNLAPNTDYYLNIIQTDPTSTRGCTQGNATCLQAQQSSWGR